MKMKQCNGKTFSILRAIFKTKYVVRLLIEEVVLLLLVLSW